MSHGQPFELFEWVLCIYLGNDLFVRYAQAFFIICTIAIYLQAIAGIFFNKRGAGCIFWVGKSIDWVASLMLYLGTICIIISICTLERCATPENKDQAFMCMVGNKDVTTLVVNLKKARDYDSP